MAYTGLTITTAAITADGKYSHCIPAYPEYTTSTYEADAVSFPAAHYTERRASNDALLGATITYS